ncbi:MAG TPA: outer membrane protein transport protein [Gemmatimonadales bacterium]|nr:outer membrane protein transport protein [Gemmatimonadales bacterium]
MRRFVWLLLAGVPSVLGAQGFAVYEHNACAMGRAAAGVASPCADGSAVLYNPASVADLNGTHVSLGWLFISANGGFTPDPGVYASDASTSMTTGVFNVPNAYITHKYKKVGFGLGLFIPYGLGTAWCAAGANCSNGVIDFASNPQPNINFAGRFSGYKTDLRAVYIQPTVAFPLTKQLNFGFGVDFITSKIELHQRADLSTQQVPGAPSGTTFAMLGVAPYTDFADAGLSANGTGVTWHLGLSYKANDDLSFGLRFLAGRQIRYSGNAKFTQVATNLVLAPGNPLGLPGGTPVDALLAGQFTPGGALASDSARTSINMPSQLVVGFAYKVMPKLTLLGDIQYTYWNSFDQLVIEFPSDSSRTITQNENYNNTTGFRLGADYAHNDKLSLRLGYLYHNAASPSETVTPLLPEGSRNEVTAGVGYVLTKTVRADVAYQYIKQQDRRGRLTEGPNTGLYNFSASLVGLGLSLSF